MPLRHSLTHDSTINMHTFLRKMISWPDGECHSKIISVISVCHYKECAFLTGFSCGPNFWTIWTESRRKRTAKIWRLSWGKTWGKWDGDWMIQTSFLQTLSALCLLHSGITRLSNLKLNVTSKHKAVWTCYENGLIKEIYNKGFLCFG